MKPIGEVTALVADYGTFIDLAQALSRDCKKVYYHSPTDAEYRDFHDCVIGVGVPGIERVEEIIDPEIMAEVDLFVFPDIGWGGTQRYLRSVGKAVWGSMGASDLELYRTRFLKTIAKLGLEVVPYKVVKGVEALASLLREVKRKWIKINRYRENMETWFHLDWEHSADYVRELWVAFGDAPVVFVVQDEIAGNPDSPVLEIGYDGATVDGEFPCCSFQGYEKKNELYLGSLLDYKDLPKVVCEVNDAMRPVYRDYGYRNFNATELRVREGKAYFIDPTMRLAGQTMEHQFKNCKNLAEFIWKGAQGELIKPEFEFPFVAEGTLHYKGSAEGFKTLVLSDEIKPWVKLYHYYVNERGVCKFPPACNDECGVIIGGGSDIEESIESLKEHVEALGDEPVSVNVAEFADLLKQIEDAEAEGIQFSDSPVPDPASAIA